MNKSDSIGNLILALSLAQNDFATITKTAENPFFESKYAPLDAVIQATQEALTKNGLAVSQLVEENTLITLLGHKSGEWISSTINLKPVKDDPQGQGSAITYARRYALAAILNVASEDDDDGNQATHKPKTGGNLDV